MPLLDLVDKGGYRSFDETQCRAVGQSLADRYRSADPFPHIVLDDFIDAGLLRQVVRDFPSTEGRNHFQREQERLKYQFHPQECSGLAIRNLFAELNSQALLSFLSEMTGMKGLIADAYYNGAGLHETKRGGHLSIHADFNRHGRMKVERRLNLLIYLNDDWDESYGGALELWDQDMTACKVAAYPIMARAVVFNTDLDSYHGHPDPLRCTPDRSRRSIATYYYTAFDDGIGIDRSTNFRTRPNSGDARDWRLMLHNLVSDWTPPAVRRRRRAG